jgi:aryl-alcohol dehydrogenase-like predicted oxidoreductase
LCNCTAPPIETYYHPEVFEAMDRLQREGKIRFYGVSVEKVEEGLKALEYPGVVSVQIIYNMFRQRPEDLFLEQARKHGVAVIARVPLASGLLAGKFKPDTKFDPNDHRQFNRHGEAFDVGETFAGIPYEAGLAAVEEIRPLVPKGVTMAQLALRWILMNEAISVVIPGAKNAEQARANIGAASLASLSPETMAHSINLRSAYQACGTLAVVNGGVAPPSARRYHGGHRLAPALPGPGGRRIQLDDGSA